MTEKTKIESTLTEIKDDLKQNTEITKTQSAELLPNMAFDIKIIQDLIKESAQTAASAATAAALQAIEVAKHATEVVNKKIEHEQSQEERTTNALAEALREVFGENQKSQRFIDTSRIPLICKSIYDMHEKIERLLEWMEKSEERNDDRYVNKDQWWPVKTIVYSGVGLALVALASAVITSVLQ